MRVQNLSCQTVRISVHDKGVNLMNNDGMIVEHTRANHVRNIKDCWALKDIISYLFTIGVPESILMEPMAEHDFGPDAKFLSVVTSEHLVVHSTFGSQSLCILSDTPIKTNSDTWTVIIPGKHPKKILESFSEPRLDNRANAIGKLCDDFAKSAILPPDDCSSIGEPSDHEPSEHEPSEHISQEQVPSEHVPSDHADEYASYNTTMDLRQAPSDLTDEYAGYHTTLDLGQLKTEGSDIDSSCFIDSHRDQEESIQ